MWVGGLGAGGGGGYLLFEHPGEWFDEKCLLVGDDERGEADDRQPAEEFDLLGHCGSARMNGWEVCGDGSVGPCVSVRMLCENAVRECRVRMMTTGGKCVWRDVSVGVGVLKGLPPPDPIHSAGGRSSSKCGDGALPWNWKMISIDF